MPATLQINYFNLESTSLCLTVFRFQKATLVCDGRALWNLGDFRTCLWALSRTSYNWFSAGWCIRTSVKLSSTFFSRFWNETVLFTNFTLSISESTWSSFYPRLTKNCFNCSRQLLIFSSIEQILLNLTTYPHAIDILYTLRWYDCASSCWCVSFGLQYISVSNLLETFCYSDT